MPRDRTTELRLAQKNLLRMHSFKWKRYPYSGILWEICHRDRPFAGAWNRRIGCNWTLGRTQRAINYVIAFSAPKWWTDPSRQR